MPTRKKIRGTNEYVDVGDDGEITVVDNRTSTNIAPLVGSRPKPTSQDQANMTGGDQGTRWGERAEAALPAVAGAVASPMGLPAEMAASGATSYGINALKQDLSQRYPGSVAEPAVSPMQGALTDMAMEGVFGGIPRVLNKLKSMGKIDTAVAKKSAKYLKPDPANALDAEDMKLLDGLGLDTTAGQQGGNSYVKSLEKRFGGRAYEDIRQRQEKGLQSELLRVAGGDSSENALQGVQKQWAQELSQNQAEQKSNFSTLMRHKDPIKLDLAQTQANSIKTKLKESDQLRTPMSKELSSIVDGLTAANPKGTGAPMDAILDVEDRLHSLVSNPKTSERDRRLAQSLMTSVDKDVRTGAGNLTGNWDNYQLARKRISDQFDGKEVGKILDSPYLEHSKIQKVLENPTSYPEARAASKNIKQFDAAVKEQFLARIIEKSTDGTTFKLGQPIKELMANKEAYGRFFTAAERAPIDQLMRTMERVAPEAVSTGNASLSMAQKGGMVVAGSLLASVLPGHLLGAFGGAGALALGAEVGAQSFVKKILLNPTNAKIVSQLAKMPPNSQQAKILSNHLFLGMKGAQIALRQPEGGIIGWGTIGENGKWQPNSDGKEAN